MRLLSENCIVLAMPTTTPNPNRTPAPTPHFEVPVVITKDPSKWLSSIKFK